ncbi:DUF262 domain-containing protein [Ktedonobacter robiniae]|uniref:DUF262 domain-containing protein n=1 Tax=Ktedonobacter robiniae TaxID=2778365 RepID=A0ABQ3V2A0_9CHLR|nr:DUF262 domain-containing protein [Ktedonobacter robiniae]GHO59284.1 hypothetical protein KSB_77590 [Ktedonobacter robiniae]
MECYIHTISRIFNNGGNTHYVLPHFQREYIWEKEQWKELLRDLFYVHQEYEAGKQKIVHFLGLMVIVPDGMISGTIPKSRVVDGQQRLITISLILCVLRDLCKKKKKLKSYALRIETMLINQYETGYSRFKVLPSSRREDCSVYTTIVDNHSLGKRPSRILDAYRYLYREISRRISANGILPEKLYEVLVNCFQVALVILNQDNDIESPYKIFESLDGKGKILSQADLVRNYIAMTLPLDLQKQVFEDDWIKIDEMLQEQREHGKPGQLTVFLRHYLAMRRNILHPEERVYIRFRDYIEQYYQESEAFRQEISNLRLFAEYYHKLLLPNKEVHEGIQKTLIRLMPLDLSISYPFLLANYHACTNGHITTREFIHVLEIIENLLVRRYLCGLSPSILGKWFAGLWREIEQEQNGNNLVETCQKHIASTKYYPTDRQIRQAIQEVRLYGGKLPQNRAKITFVLRSIEESLWQHTDIVAQLKGNSTIEHVMPQVLTQAWKEELGDNWEQVHKDFLHTLGNLTLVTQAKNGQLGNSSFKEKKQLLLSQGLRLNAYFDHHLPCWDENAISTRAQWLTQHILTIWPTLV